MKYLILLKFTSTEIREISTIHQVHFVEGYLRHVASQATTNREFEHSYPKTKTTRTSTFRYARPSVLLSHILNKEQIKTGGMEIVMSAPLHFTFVARPRIFNRGKYTARQLLDPFLRRNITPTFNLAKCVANSVRLIGRSRNRGERCKKTRYTERSRRERNRIILRRQGGEEVSRFHREIYTQSDQLRSKISGESTD